MKKNIIEVCASSVQSAINAQIAGAHRIELCNGLELGGVTPSHSTIKMARELLEIEIFVLIRPRSGDFCYSDLEFEIIKQEVLFCKKNDIDGIAIGMLHPSGEVNFNQLKELVELAKPMQVTFHRAFDRATDPLIALEKVIEAGAVRILTSGQAATALDGKVLLEELVKKANGRISIMPGAGINARNILEIATSTKAIEFHLSGKSIIKSPMKVENSKVKFSQNKASEDDYSETDVEKIKAVLEKLKMNN